MGLWSNLWFPFPSFSYAPEGLDASLKLAVTHSSFSHRWLLILLFFLFSVSFSVLPSSIIIRQLGQKSEAFGSVDVSTSPAALLSQCWHNCVNAEPTHGRLSICQPLLFPHEQLYRLWPQKPVPAKLQDAVFVPINEIKMSFPRLTLKGLTSALSFNWYDYIIVFANTMQPSLICSCFTTFGLLKTSHWEKKHKRRNRIIKHVVVYSSSSCVIIWFDRCGHVFQSLFSKLWLSHLYPP